MSTIGTDDQWKFWREALAARRGVETDPGHPRSGYFRLKGEALAFWREDGEVVCWRSGTKYPVPSRPDAIDELFGWCAPHPISFEDFTHFQHHGRWPDDIAPVEIAANLAPHERADAELTAQREAMAKWVAEIGKIATQEQATKAGNFADVFAKIEKVADETRKNEKEPHKTAADAVDARWQPIVKRAGELKTYAKKQTEAFLIADRARIKAEEDARREAIAKAAREADERRRQAEAAGAPPPAPEPTPMFAPAPQKSKAGKVHLREVTKHEITNMRAVLEYIAKLNEHPGELVDVVQVIVNQMRAAGVEIPGVETKKLEVAA